MADDNDIKLAWPRQLEPVPGVKQGAKNTIAFERRVVPVVFVPGIMGTRLKNKEGEKVWDPDDAKFMVLTYGTVRTGPADKKKLLVGDMFQDDYLEPFRNDVEHNDQYLGGGQEGIDRARRGWGALAWGSYGNILQKLERGPFHEKLKKRAWRDSVRLSYMMPVWAFGYNWTASNALAGERLREFVRDKVQKKHGPCKVILVTHSMGGLVARHACADAGFRSQVLGVVHGVQPASGAPAAYWRMKAGFERPRSPRMPASFEQAKKVAKDYVEAYIGAWVLGTNGEEVTALLGNMPGGLQLLPCKAYTTNPGRGGKRWLRIENLEGKAEKELPESDPYDEIYKVPEAPPGSDGDSGDTPRYDYWRLVNPDHLSPERDESSLYGPATALGVYNWHLEQAKQFHQTVTLQAGYPVASFYGDGAFDARDDATADRVVFKQSPTGWVKKGGEYALMALKAAAYTVVRGPVTGARVLAWEVFKRTDIWQLRGGFKTEIEDKDLKFEVVLQPADGAGDGTVPASSGQALEGKHAHQGFETPKGFQGIAHEPAYRDGADPQVDTDAQAYLFKAIEEFCLHEVRRQLGKA